MPTLPSEAKFVQAVARHHNSRGLFTYSNNTAMTDSQEAAVMNAWKCPFEGNAANNLWEHITTHLNDADGPSYLSIVQSSGMGKSRAVDELAKSHFVIPMNLRVTHSTGFPPADDSLRDFLDSPTTHVEARGYVRIFLSVLFKVTLQKLQTEFAGSEPTEIPGLFREAMALDQTFHFNGPFRESFCKEVVLKSRKKLVIINSTSTVSFAQLFPKLKNHSQSLLNYKVRENCRKLVDHICRSEKKDNHPTVILLCDEAHTLIVNRGRVERFFVLAELQLALNGLESASCFSLFLSTTGKIAQVSPYGLNVTFFRGQLKPIPPFVDLGFDHLASKITLDGLYDLDTVTSNDHMSHLGRPLFGSLYDNGTTETRRDLPWFAASKLLCTSFSAYLKWVSNEGMLACLSLRIPLEFKPASHHAQDQEIRQVERHMRVYHHANPLFDGITTISPSEPLLSYAAFLIMKTVPFDVPYSMMTILHEFSLDTGDRGELLAMLLLTIARDNVSSSSQLVTIPELLANLLRVPQPISEDAMAHTISDASAQLTDDTQSTKHTFHDLPDNFIEQLTRDFPDSCMYFTQFIKVNEYSVIEPKRLLALASRGAAVLCRNQKQAIDGVNTFLLGSKKLDVQYFSCLLWTVKNNPLYGSEPEAEVFAAMDEVDLGDVSRIKIVFALASEQPALKFRRLENTPGVVIYEIWCAGITPDVFSAIEVENAYYWDALLRASYSWKKIWHGGGADQRSMYPGGASDEDHWAAWGKLD